MKEKIEKLRKIFDKKIAQCRSRRDQQKDREGSVFLHVINRKWKRRLSEKRKPLIALVVVCCLCVAALLYPYSAKAPLESTEAVTETETLAPMTESTTEVAETIHENGLRYGGIHSKLADISEYEDNFTPEADKLNLAYFYAEDADISDVIHSYAGEEYKKLMSEDNQYIANIYDQAGVSPLALAKRLGVSTGRVLGKYNPTASGQDENNPATWFVPDFKHVNVSFYNADGEQVNEYSNVKDIMAMASVYCFAHDYRDVDTFIKYCDELYQKSRKYTISIGKVYYDNGCINRSAKEEQEDAEKLENAMAALQQSLRQATDKTQGIVAGETQSQQHIDVTHSGETSAEKSETAMKVAETTTASAASVAETSSTSAASSVHETTADGLEQILVLGNADMAVERDDILVLGDADSKPKETKGTETTAETKAETVAKTEAETKNGAETKATERDTESAESGKRYANIEAGRGIAEINQSYEHSKKTAANENTVSEETSATVKTNEHSTESSDAGKITLGTFTEEQLRAMDEGTLRKLLESSLAAEKDKLNANDVKDVNDKNYCPGHVDLYVKVTLAGFDDKNGLRTIPLDLEENSDKASDWDGWTEEQVENVEKLIAQDWFKTYGLTISTINPKKPLTEEEVSKYMADLPEDVSEERKAVIKFALQSVGKIPYYWGGKAAKKNYEGNGFGKVIGADYKGRVLRGLDCSGWVQWVYWSAIGNNLHEARSTASLIGEGEKIKRADLKPGDVIVRIGADSHVVMFLQWAGNGNMIAIHENSAANTVSVNEVTANYPYYRRLIA
ncbi:MAG TPA: hypothetical protein DCS54_00260 [Oribacterium sp.]|nr:hypothetical protein [Oribacterium sp.]